MIIVRHKRQRGGTQTVRSTVYAVSPEGYAEMAEEHAAIVLSSPAFGWELYAAPAAPPVAVEAAPEVPESKEAEAPAEPPQAVLEAPEEVPAEEPQPRRPVAVPERLTHMNRSALLELAGSLGVDTRSLRKASNEAIVLAIRSAQQE